MSLPAQNARPVPVRTTARTSGSSFTWVTWLIRAAVIDDVKALSLAGRSMVRYATWSRSSIRTRPGSSVMGSGSFPALLAWRFRAPVTGGSRGHFRAWCGTGRSLHQVRAGAFDDLAHRGFRLPVMTTLDGLRHPLMGRQRLAVVRDRVSVQRADRAERHADHVVDVQQQVVLAGREHGPVYGQVGHADHVPRYDRGQEPAHGRGDHAALGRAGRVG